MSDPIHSWVDPDELRRIGELLMAEQPEAPPVVVEEAAYGTAFEGFDQVRTMTKDPSSTVQSTAVKNLAEAKRLAEAGGILGKRASEETNATEPGDEPDQPVHAGPFLERMGAFGQWLRQEVLVQRFFLLDQRGDILLDEIADADLTDSAYSLAVSSVQATRQSSTSHLPSLALQSMEGEIVEVIPTETHYGGMVLGLQVSTRISPETARIVAEGLQRAVEPPAAT